ncbi:Protein CBG09830 [Caenorhabditis briggsae]|uniref:Peptidase metallopeptidase domain-containing protein n=2 Tax=Caenorhabditis briggsae TaxID=6238 RepID=A0AAE9EMY0_CAEBR|nr:Protein CBG09830 [Caenorhabditis briggsae]ULU01572.1 hypothetical protein L3Y34_001714 [Caenorhabditis briggsae]UMM24217.1 hypothetical protein L5515_004559 [Caenorhabditis briggsae]CAP29379.1 Protein CBG09830 [Caenorhabditis briggsae]
MTKWSPNGYPLTIAIPTLPHIYLMLSLFSLAHTAPHRTELRTTSSRASSSEDTSFDSDEAFQFVKGQMEKYGYLTDQKEFKDALKVFQEVLEVEQTGVVDEATMEAASKPRCTQKDIANTPKRSRRFTLSKRSKWGEDRFTGPSTITLKWYISEYTNDIDRMETRRVVKKAFELWSSQSYIKHEKKVALNFVEAASKEDSDINILWAEGSHGDEYPFDGANGKIEGNKKENVLAHTFFPGYAFPLNGDIHFDDAETWEVDVDEVGGAGNRKRFFPYVLAHEIGHALGLDHSQKSDALMHPYYKNVPIHEIQLDVDDKCGVIWNYGGSSNFCLYVWLMSQIIEAHNSSAQNSPAVGSITSSRNGKKLLKNAKIPKCSITNSSLRTNTEKKLTFGLQLSESDAKHYTDIVCNFLAGLHVWRAGSAHNPNESLEKEYKGVVQEMSGFGGRSSISVRRLIRHAEHEKQESRKGPLDPEYFDDDFFEQFFMNYT